MHKRASEHLRFMIWVLLIAVLFGLLIDELLIVLLLSLSVYLSWTVRQALRLHTWLYSPNKEENIPESYGLWGDLFEGLYHSQQQNLKARDRLSRMINRVRSSANALKDGVVMTNEIGQLDWWNEAASLLFGFDERTDQAQLITNLFRDPEFKAYFEQKRYDDALEIASPTDPNLILRIHITLFGEDERLILAQDVTRLHHLEEMRKDFVSNVSHEMRTPLTVIRGYVETLLDSPDAPQRWQRALRSMESQTQRLEAIISDLMLLEKYEAKDGAGMEEEVDMGLLIRNVCKDAELYSGDRKHTIRFELDTTSNVLGIENQLRSAVSNLVFNAVKYTKAGGDVLVKWSQDHSGCHLMVKDNGCGFDPIHIPRLTERFYRADPSRNQNTGGSGLGLAIVKHVLINHSATLEINSIVNRGSEFTCHFPNQRIIELAEIAQQQI